MTSPESPDQENPSPRNRAITALMDKGFTYGEADLIATAWIAFTPHGDYAWEANYYAFWRDAGFGVWDIMEWVDQATFHPEQAAIWANHDWHPTQVAQLQGILTAGLPDDSRYLRQSDQVQGQITAWVLTRIPPTWCLRYAAAGHTPDTISRLEADRAAGIDHAAGLATLAALRDSRPQ